MKSNNSKIAKKSEINQEKSNKPMQLFSVKAKKLELDFVDENISSDGGALLLKEVENQIGIVEAINSVISDNRHQSYVEHEQKSMLMQRVFQIACAYEDANDCDSLKSDPIFKLCSDNLPETDNDLASQPTMSRMENAISRTELYRIAIAIATDFINSYETEPEVIVLDFDDTNSNVYGNQQLSFFNNYYGEYCFMPLHVYEGISGKLITTILKPGRRSKGSNVLSILKRVVNFIREYWKDTYIVYRGDAHFSSPEISKWIDTQENLHAVTGLTGNSVLNRNVETTLASAKKLHEERKANKMRNTKAKLYHSFYYKAKSWHKSQRVIAKVEYSEKGKNIRFILTTMTKCKTQQLYEEIYCARGKMELYIKEHKRYLKSDRTSCHKFEANQFRLFLHSAAYILIHTLQKSILKNTEFENATMQTIQLKLLKTAAKVKQLKTKIKIKFPTSCLSKTVFEKSFGIFQALRC